MNDCEIYVIRISRSQKFVKAIEEISDVIEPHPNPVPEALRSIPILSHLGKLKRHLGPLVSDVRRSDESTIVIINAVDEFSALVGLICKLIGVPFVIRLRGTMWHAFRDWAHNKGTLHQWMHSKRRDNVRNFALSLSDGIIPVSDFVITQMLYETDLDRQKMKVAHNVMETNRFESAPVGKFKQEYGIPQENKVLLLVTAFDYARKYGAIEYFAPAINRVLHEHQDWCFVVAGAGRACPRNTDRELRFYGF